MDKIQATGNRNKVLTGGMIDVAQDGSVLQGVYAPAVLVRDEAERDALPADYPPGTIAFTPGEAQKWQKTQDGAWADYVGGSGSSGGGSGSAQYMAIFASGMQMKGRLSSLDTTVLASGSVVEAVGIPAYVSDVTDYAAYGITDPGWYVFARVTAEGGVYTQATVTAGEAVTENTYYEDAYTVSEDAAFQDGKAYYTKDGAAYTQAAVTAGDALPAQYFVHTKLSFAGMERNVTYRLDDLVDCPIEITLPQVPENGHGAWFEIQLRYNGSYSCTLLPPEGVKIGTAQTQAQTAGINTIDLQYTAVDDVKMWTLLNTHSDIPA